MDFWRGADLKTLLLLRHGEAGSSPDDRERALTRKGFADTEHLGGVLVRRRLVPGATIASAARRAAESARSVVDGIGHDVTITEREDLYLAAARTILDAVHGAPDGVGTLLMVGHNPGLQDLAGQLSGDGNQDALASLGMPLPPGGVIVIEFSAARWAEVAAGDGTLKAILTPPDYL